MECNLQRMNMDTVRLVRRRSGGGTVFHVSLIDSCNTQDVGNANFCAIMPRSEFNRKTYSSLVSRALLDMDIPNHINERFDLLIQGQKIIFSSSSLHCTFLDQLTKLLEIEHTIMAQC